ncbi:hypothetical protein K503DRAFT_21762 [Rhizopogon vinicolor AM-OR11-026]|uniref:BTB domain-containing protein n=1 Tax=Rhizopogon vinicolor AM-OR11-026 TaxID=1314800 RepID=A0A1B7N5M9_9AGAM|nr:hypothetical protein K503DRAFT_21762 [Rhizopogon vinicolor AM-OR11-026]
MSEVEKTSTANAPFDNLANCDIILRSADGVNFHVFKLILSLVSPVFQGMFMLPQGISQPDASSVPVVPMAESSTTLESLLLLCYPAATPTFDSLDDVKAVLEAARKYVMITVLGRAKDLVFAQFLPTDSLGLYALSCMFGWQQHARMAAIRTLEINLKDLGRPGGEFAGMRDISAFDYHKLLVYHYECGIAAQAVGESLSWLKWSSNLEICMWKCGSVRGCKSARMLHIGKLGEQLITPWFDEYLVSSGKELYARPCDSILSESAAYNGAINKALACSYCRGMVVDSMDKFRTLYVAQVKKMVANVRLRAD